MRKWTVALLAAFALNALAQDGEQVMPRIDLPGEQAVQKKLAITDKHMDSWDLTGDDRSAVKNKVAELNTARAELIQQLTAARDEVKTARKKLDGALAALRQQEASLYAFIKPMLPADKRGEFDLRVELQPLIDWLDLSDDQAGQLVKKRNDLITEFGGREDYPVARIAKAAGDEVTAANRADYKELVTKYMEFNQKWLAAVKGLLDDKQKTKWENRFRRTMHTLGEDL
ncbi:hypothetical protein ACFL09_06570 [Planctomycetota bacterium]